MMRKKSRQMSTAFQKMVVVFMCMYITCNSLDEKKEDDGDEEDADWINKGEERNERWQRSLQRRRQRPRLIRNRAISPSNLQIFTCTLVQSYS